MTTRKQALNTLGDDWYELGSVPLRDGDKVYHNDEWMDVSPSNYGCTATAFCIAARNDIRDLANQQEESGDV